MSERTYVPGPGTALVGPSAVLLLAAEPAERLNELWPLVRDEADLETLLEGLAAGGMRRLGAFALLHGRQVVLRGTGTAFAAGELHSAAGTTAWAERSLDAGPVTLSLGGADQAEPLPVVAAVVRASAVHIGSPVGASAAGAATPVETAGTAPPAPVTVLEAAPVQPEPLPEPAPAVQAIEVAHAPRPQPAALGRPAGGDANPPVVADTVPPDWTRAPTSGLVDDVPVASSAAPSGAEDDGEYDHLFGATVHRSVEEAAVRPVAEDETVAPPPVDTDHDGSTVMRSQLTAMRAAAGPEQPRGPRVDGVACPSGHANPPHRSHCRVCGAAVPDVDPRPLPRPPLGRLRSSDGSVVLLDRTVLVGRAPTASRFSPDDAPHLLRVPSPQQDISRTHVEVRVEDWDVLVVDVSANGTRLVRPGMEPQMLHRGEPVLVLPGSVLDLGDGVTLSYDAETA